MHRYFIKTPAIVKRFFPSFTWTMPVDENTVYLTFDDGPHPIVTAFVLDVLKEHNVNATFFCIGKNVSNNIELYKRILEEGHTVGNHTQNHLNGWKTPLNEYVNNVTEAAQLIQSNLFRPPYGRIKLKQAAAVKQVLGQGSKIVMWDVLSGDFDNSISAEECIQNVILNTEPGSIIVFHDSKKAFENLKKALPVVIENFKSRGFKMKPLEQR